MVATSQAILVSTFPAARQAVANVPLGVFCMVTLGTTMREWPTERRPIDVLGIFLLASGLASLQYFLERGEIKQWFDDPGIRIAAFEAMPPSRNQTCTSSSKTMQQGFCCPPLGRGRAAGNLRRRLSNGAAIWGIPVKGFPNMGSTRLRV
ncbi:MAG: hypothetical protein ACYDGM_01000, partial [Vulcanimicrobiaceae bacterium]